MAQQNPFAGLIEKWKIDLTAQRAYLKGFTQDEMQDLKQDLALVLYAFVYDPTVGASEKTVLTAVIDNHLRMVLRSRARRQKHEDIYREHFNPPEQTCDLRDAHDADDLRLDVQEAMADLTDQEREVCQHLACGHNPYTTARRMGISRYRLSLIMDRIRAGFRASGLERAVQP